MAVCHRAFVAAIAGCLAAVGCGSSEPAQRAAHAVKQDQGETTKIATTTSAAKDGLTGPTTTITEAYDQGDATPAVKATIASR